MSKEKAMKMIAFNAQAGGKLLNDKNLCVFKKAANINIYFDLG